MSRIIPTYENGKWGTTEFSSDLTFREYLESIFKEPGKYSFNKLALKFNQEATTFNDQGFYCNAPFRSKDFTKYWEDQKNKCRTGVIYKSNGKEWYLTRDYYMWLNFLPIFDKEEKKYGFAKVRDAQYHMALYEIISELNKNGLKDIADRLEIEKQKIAHQFNQAELNYLQIDLEELLNE